MNSIKSLAIAGALLISVSYACAQTAQVHPKTPPPAMQGSSPSAESITVSGAGPRPLEQALSTLRIKYGWVINYEDPQYLFGKDVMDDPHIKGSLIPAGTSFSAEIPAPSSTDAAANNQEKTLQLIVDSYNRSGNPGQFELRKAEGNVISVVGVAARDHKGAVAPQKPLLDTMVSVPAQSRTISDTIDLLCKALTGETQVPVSIGITPRSLVDHTNVTAGGNKVAARTMLAQTLAASGHELYWQLLFDPNSKSYLLNIHSARVPKAANQNWRGNPGEKQSKPPSPAPHP
jgi:hypothetical protein